MRSTAGMAPTRTFDPMQAPIKRRVIAPRIGVYLGIFTSALISLVIILLIVEQLGTPSSTISMTMIVAPLALYLTIAFLAYAMDAGEYFAANRSVPALLNGLAMSITCIGGIGIVSLTGLFFFIGHDAFAFAIGWMLGLMVLGIMLAPYLRKYGASTVPAYLGRRFANKTLRITVALLLVPPVILVMAAEMKIAISLLAQFAGQPAGETMAIGAVLVFCMVSIGGMFGLTWSNCAQAIAAFCGLLIPLTIVSLKFTNLPFPQMTYGLMLDRLGLRELSNGLQPLDPAAGPPAMNLPGVEPALLTKPFMEAFGAMSSTGFVITALVIMAGIASMPALLVRSGTTRSVYDMRKSMGWTVFFVGLVMLSLPAIAVFFRFILLDTAIGTANDAIPGWFRTLVASGFISVDEGSPSLSLETVRFARDGVFGGFAIATGLPTAMVFLAVAGALAAAMAAITAQTLTLANMLTDDLVFGAGRLPAANLPRLIAARLFVSVAVVAGGITALQVPVDPLRLFCWGLSFSAATIFPCLILSIWWKRITGSGALAGMIAGFAATLAYILAARAGLTPVLIGNDDMFAAIIGLPVSLTVTVAAWARSHTTPCWSLSATCAFPAAKQSRTANSALP